MLTLRPVSSDDFVTVSHLIRSPEELFLVHPSGRFPWTVKQLQRQCEERLELTVMEEGSAIIGFANLYGLQEGEYAYIGNVIIDSAHRAHGYGRALLDYMLQRIFIVHSLREARISVFAHNTVALKLYHSFGFLPYGVQLRQSSDGKRFRLLHMSMASDA